MSRKEEIEKAAWCNYPLIKGGEEQFIQGAEWADRTFLNNLWHDSSKETPIQGSNILMIRKDEKDSNYPPIAGCFHGTNSRLDGRNWGYYNGFCYNEIEPPLKWAYVDDLLNLSNVQRTVKNWKEEPIRGDFEMALAEMIDKAQKCVVEPWVVAAQWKDELVKLAKECKAMKEHPKDCMYSKDNYTDEDRKILCEGCEEDCKYNKKEEPVSEDLEEEIKRYFNDWYFDDELDILAKPNHYSATVDDAKDIARHFAEWGRNQAMAEIQAQSMAFAHRCPKEPVREDLEKELPKVWDRKTLDEYAYQVAYDLSNDWMKETPTWNDVETACKLGSEWKEKQMMRDAVEVPVSIMPGWPHAIIGPKGLKGYNLGDKVKLIIIKEDCL